MKKTCNRWMVFSLTVVVLCLLLSGCANITPTEPEPPPIPPVPTVPPADSASPMKVSYSYADTGNVQLSANNLTLKLGQQLVLEPAAKMTGRTRFVSSGESYIGDILRQESDQAPTTQVIFTAIKAGKGKLQIIPNMTETERATDLWVTVE